MFFYSMLTSIILILAWYLIFVEKVLDETTKNFTRWQHLFMFLILIAIIIYLKMN
jgi:hypothetical protein